MKLVIYFLNLYVFILSTKPDDQTPLDAEDFDHSDFQGFVESKEELKGLSVEPLENYIIN